MDRNKLEHFKNRLYEEKESIESIINRLEDDMGVGISQRDETSELSLCDNHPGDIGSETFEAEKNKALKANELTHMKMIEDSLARIKKGTYGICNICGSEISDERLEVIPFTSLCIDCEKTEKPDYKTYWQDRPIEETVVRNIFGNTNRDPEDYTGYDGEDVWQELESYNSLNYMAWDDNEDDEDQGIVEDIDRISNEQYRRQLPD